MIKRIIFFFILYAHGVCFAQHWCVMKPVKDDGPAYPPIAKAARFQGVVISRLEFDSSGNVSKVEIVSGPPLLTRVVENTEAKWIFHADAGNGGCQILVISEFTLSASEQANEDKTPWPYTPPGIYRRRIRALFLPPLDAEYRSAAF